ncbi:MAG: polyphosphate polymerase domain-containing protein [Gemmatimonadota bacterium]
MAQDVNEFNRFEFKYLVSAKRLNGLLEELSPYTRWDPYSGNGEGYRVYSIYWDSPGLTCFWEKLEGLEIRRKLRFRTYGTGPDVFVEIKGRTDRTVQKRRVRLPLAEASRLLTSGPRGAGMVAGHPVAEEVEVFAHRYQLAPRMAIAYRRRALFGSETSDLRVTFDSRIQYSAADLDISRPFETGQYLMDPRVVVMEIKYNGRAPLWLSKLVSRREFHLIRLSKYCTAVDKVYFEGQLT